MTREGVFFKNVRYTFASMIYDRVENESEVIINKR